MDTSAKIKKENSVTLKRDKALIKKTLKGDSQAFAELMSFYYNRVQALGRQFFYSDADSEDFIQEVFLKVFKNLSSFRGESSFATWLTRIAFTTAINTKKRVKDFQSIPDDMDLPSSIKSPEEQQILSITQQAVNEAIKELPEKYAICLTLYFFHDLSHEEISSVTGFPINTIKSHIFRAKKILRQKLQDYSPL